LIDANGGIVNLFRVLRDPSLFQQLIELAGDLENHYSQMARYLRMNGMLPLSVKK
jgi:hypothetical protein